jgi:hypothetical protein
VLELLANPSAGRAFLICHDELCTWSTELVSALPRNPHEDNCPQVAIRLRKQGILSQEA